MLFRFEIVIVVTLIADILLVNTSDIALLAVASGRLLIERLVYVEAA